MSQALAAANYAVAIGADAVAHGSTGAGNDQVRFDMVIQVLVPDWRSSLLSATRN